METKHRLDMFTDIKEVLFRAETEMSCWNLIGDIVRTVLATFSPLVHILSLSLHQFISVHYSKKKNSTPSKYVTSERNYRVAFINVF